MLARLNAGLFSGLLLCAWCPVAAAEDWARPDDPFYRRYPAEPHQENLFLLEMEKAWEIEKGSKDVVVAVIDWAFDVRHPDLRNQMVAILHHHDPALPDRTGAPSRMMDARVISVPASGTADA